MMRNSVVKLTLSLLTPLLVGSLGAATTFPEITTWYVALKKPLLTPPNWIFGPVWTSLYLFMGIAFYLYWMAKGGLKNWGYGLFGVQLLLNLAWSLLFFGLHSPTLGLVDIGLLWLLLLATMVLFFKTTRWSGVLLLPYWFWISFAAYLNFGIWRLN